MNININVYGHIEMWYDASYWLPLQFMICKQIWLHGWASEAIGAESSVAWILE